MTTPSWDDDDGRYQVSFGVEKSRRYHEKMAAFYTSWTDFVGVANAIIGVSAFLALMGGRDAYIVQILVGGVALASTVTATLRPSKKAKQHSDLQRRFTELAAEIAGREPTDANLRYAEKQRKKIESDEPPTRRLVDMIARNEECRARGHGASEIAPLTWAQRHFGYLFTFGLSKLDRWDAQRRLS